MAEPLSTVASTIAIVGFAVDSTKVVFKFFHELARMPAAVHDSLITLNSFHVTLTRLQQSSTKLDSKYTFPAHFCRRISECLQDLKTFEAKIGETDAILDKKRSHKRNWNGKTRRSWERVRWLLMGEQDTKRFLDKVKAYQNEFSLELLFLLT